MKKNKLHPLMVRGIISGLFVAHHSVQANEKAPDSIKAGFLELVATTGGNVTFKDMTQDDLMLELNAEGARIYNSLDPDSKKLALKLASRACNNQNDCAGQNACRSGNNECAGKGECAGKTICAFSDKNVAVKVAAKLADKRKKSLEQNHQQPPPR